MATQEPARAAAAGSPPDPSLIRPYLLTGGRVGPLDATLEIETQVVMTSAGTAAAAGLSFERGDILLLCAEPVSIAEITARLGMHLGVARVIVGDLVAEGHLCAHRPPAGVERSVPIIERVIRGLQAIR